jgi:hypothetical protein
MLLSISAAAGDEQCCNALAKQQDGELPMKRLPAFQSGRVSAIGTAFSGSRFSALGQSVERYVGHLQPSGPVVRPRSVHFCRPE